MYDHLYNYISAKVQLSNTEFETIKGAFTPKILRKRQYLLQEGHVCRHIAFVVKGLLRQYLVDAKGNEHITQFAIEDWWIGDDESFANEIPSSYNIDALEDSDLLLITKEGMSELERKVAPFKELIDIIKDRKAYAVQRRIVSNLSFSAEEKYKFFIGTYPQMVQRVPQHMIAAYLGITPETLSRIRAKSSND